MKSLNELINNPLAYIYNDMLVHWLDEEHETNYKEYDLTGDCCDEFDGEEDDDN